MKETKPKVLMVGPYPPPYGGIATCVKNILDSELKKRYNIILLKTRSKKEDCKFPRINKINRVILDLINLIEILIKESPKIVHIHTSYNAGWLKHSLYLLISKLFRKKVVLHFHAILKKYKNVFPLIRSVKFIFSISSSIIVLSDSQKACLSPIIPLEKITVVPNCIDLDEFLSTTKEEKIYKIENLPKDSVKVLFLGGIEKRKGIYELLEAIPNIVSRNGNIQFIIAGKGPAEKDVEIFCENKENKLNTHYLGKVTEFEKIQLFLSSDIFVLQSYSEGLPLTLLEAMGSGLPIITTPIDAIPEVVDDGKNGFFIDPGNVEQLTSKVLELSQNKDLRTKMKQNNIKKISEEYDIKIMAKKIEKVYDTFLNS